MARSIVAAATAVVAAASGDRDSGAFATTVDFSRPGRVFDGIGALSGGGGVTRLLIDYPAQLQSDILDWLFKPGVGAALQIIKVEMGGDSQSTEGTEQSHEHFRGDLNCSRGYEWYVLQEAKKRNPAIKTYGLTWAVPAWLGDGSGNFFTADNIQYHVDWVTCATGTQGLPGVDYMGIWNERSYDDGWTKQLRAGLDAAGHNATKIVCCDSSGGGAWGIAVDMSQDPELAAAIDTIGVHYPWPNAPTAEAVSLGVPLWASEEWDLGKVADWDGAARLAQTLNGNALNNMTATIIWNLLGSWFSILPYSHPDGSPTGQLHSLMYAAEPWSGHYSVQPTVWVVAHTTQFTLANGHWVYGEWGSGAMGVLPGGGSFVTMWDGSGACGALPFSIVMETMGAATAQTVTFTFANSPDSFPASLQLWSTNETSWFVQLAGVAVANLTAMVTLQPNTLYTLTSTTGQGGGGAPTTPIPPTGGFPFPYADAFDAYAEGAYARYLSDLGGVFVVQPRPDGASGGALYQVITERPIEWETNPLPYTLVGPSSGAGGVGQWTDYAVSVSQTLDASVGPTPSQVWRVVTQPCAARAPSQQWVVHSPDGRLAQPGSIESVAHPGLCVGTDGTDPTIFNSPMVSLVPCNASAAGAAAVADVSLFPWQYNASTSQIQAADGSGVCMDVGQGSTQPGAQVITWTCKSGAGVQNQQWSLNGTGQPIALTSQLDGDCADLVAEAQAGPFTMLCGRVGVYERNGPPPSGYCLYLFPGANATQVGSWSLQAVQTVLANGTLPVPFAPGVWANTTLSFQGATVTASFSGRVLATVSDKTFAYGMAALGTGWHHAWFDDFAVAAV